MASFAAWTASGSVEAVAVFKQKTALLTCVWFYQQSFPLGCQGPADMPEMLIHLLFWKRQQLRNLSGIDLLITQKGDYFLSYCRQNPVTS